MEISCILLKTKTIRVACYLFCKWTVHYCDLGVFFSFLWYFFVDYYAMVSVAWPSWDQTWLYVANELK